MKVDVIDERRDDFHDEIMYSGMWPFLVMFEDRKRINIFNDQFLPKNMMFGDIPDKFTKSWTYIFQLIIFFLISLNIFMTKFFNKF